MLRVEVPQGALFYGTPRRRTIILFNPSLRSTTEEAAARMHELYRASHTPFAEYDSTRCDRCSLLQVCQPKRRESASTSADWFEGMLRAAAQEVL
jgi:CRISPR-associated exonuclease Cas4